MARRDTEWEVTTAAGAVPVRAPRVNDKRIDEVSGERKLLAGATDDAANKGQVGREKIFDGLLERLEQTGA